MTTGSAARVATGGALALDYADRILLRAVRDVHGSVAGRTYGAVDAVAGHRTLTHRVHDRVAESVFASIAVGLRRGSAALHALDRTLPLGPPLEDLARGRFAVSALHGLIGDQLPERAPAMVFELGFRVGGRDVGLTRPEVAAAYADASPDLVVFVHGLCETEDYWRRRVRPLRDLAEAVESTEDPRGYGDRLAQVGWTPVYVRANTGLRVSESGTALDAALTRLVAAWPVPVRRIVLVGHSMGGLVIRAALESCQPGNEPWAAKVSDVVTLGTPHLGSPVERGLALGMRLFEEVPELAPYHRIFRHRSLGVLDLAEGMPQPPTSWPGIRYRLVAASLTASPSHPLARSIGDLLVTPSSAFAEPPNGPRLFPHASTLHLPRAHHFDLLHHEDVAAAMRGWLAEPLE